ncbi:signal recognition particle 9 kDa protein-domain-containing protein [Sphaerosporella brunnea]|uniref:Signal recognition particle 9 kDa protein-domain-containing protein n=1 Tax=Sphaerosporella brunnea TaxID=1250544 RepID=A0A5J5F7A6_9PEZI|nr:signal recognition particle 9 kDa protein-domain-containing protein [Sphaerosporella brunnea]
MKLTTTPQEFTSHSAQLIRASPGSTKITTTYHANVAGKGSLTLKTYDPVSGAIVKFSTDRVADVGRLVLGLQRLARTQMGLPAGDTAMGEAPEAAEITETKLVVDIPSAAASAQQAKGKKKKGKK